MHTLKDVGWFLKFRDEREHLERIQEGYLYLNNFKYFNELDCKGIGDPLDGKMAICDMQMVIGDKDTGELLGKIKVNEGVLTSGFGESALFCLFSYDYRNMEQIGKNKFRVAFNETQCKMIEENFGEHVLFIKDRYKFMERVKKYACDNSASIIYNFVEYSDFTFNEYKRLKDCTDPLRIPFWKEKRGFEYQQEYRIIFDSPVIKAPCEISIGSLEDISEIMKTKKFLNSEFIFETY